MVYLCDREFKIVYLKDISIAINIRILTCITYTTYNVRRTLYVKCNVNKLQ